MSIIKKIYNSLLFCINSSEGDFPLLTTQGRILHLTTELIHPLASVVLIPKHNWETSEVLYSVHHGRVSNPYGHHISSFFSSCFMLYNRYLDY